MATKRKEAEETAEESSLNVSEQADSPKITLDESPDTKDISPEKESPEKSTSAKTDTATEADVDELSREKMEKLATEFYQRLNESAGQLTEYASELVDTGLGYVKTNPAKTALGAFAVGVFIGLLVGRK